MSHRRCKKRRKKKNENPSSHQNQNFPREIHKHKVIKNANAYTALIRKQNVIRAHDIDKAMQTKTKTREKNRRYTNA